jgi:hypothetical protein
MLLTIKNRLSYLPRGDRESSVIVFSVYSNRRNRISSSACLLSHKYTATMNLAPGASFDTIKVNIAPSRHVRERCFSVTPGGSSFENTRKFITAK